MDYKLNRPPDRESSVQIAVYAHAVRQEMEASDGKAHPIADATYLAFAEDKLATPIAKDPAGTGSEVEARAAAFAAAVERRSSPATFRRVRSGSTSASGARTAGVCRKEYRMEADAAESL